MATLNTKVKKYLEANSKVYKDELNNFVLQNDGSVDYIKSWNVSGLSKPTTAQLDALETQAQTYENNQQVISTRKKLYGSWESQLEEIYDDGIDNWKARIAKVKSDNPKT